MTDRPKFRIVEPSPWNRGESYNPEAIQQIRNRLNGKPRHYRPSWRSELAADFREVVSEIRERPVSHALVAIATVVGWTALLVAPLLIGERF